MPYVLKAAMCIQADINFWLHGYIKALEKKAAEGSVNGSLRRIWGASMCLLGTYHSFTGLHLSDVQILRGSVNLTMLEQVLG